MTAAPFINPFDSEAMDAFAMSRKAKKNSDSTIRTYLSDLRVLQKDLCKQGMSLLTATSEALTRYLESRARAGSKASSISRFRTTMGLFYDFLFLQGDIAENPAASVERPRFQPVPDLSRLMTPEELAVLFNQSHRYEALAKRNSLILKCVAMTDLKISQILALTLSQIGLDTEGNQVLPKKGEFVKTVLPESLLAEIQDFVESYRPDILKANDENDYLFPGWGQDRIYRQGFSQIVRDWAKGMGLPMGVRMEDVRRSYLKHMEENN